MRIYANHKPLLYMIEPVLPLLKFSVFVFFFLLLLIRPCFAQTAVASTPSEIGKGAEASGFTHQLSLEFRPHWVLPFSSFYQDMSADALTVRHMQSQHLKYSFSLPEGSLGSKAFVNTRQGIGLSYNNFGNREQLGSPIAVYLFQQSEAARFSDRLSLDYEWNFGLSTGWKPFDPERNPSNVIVGSKLNAYINLGLNLKMRLSERVDLTAGGDFSHFSNGNTDFPNVGVNSAGFKVGMLYALTEKKPILQHRGQQVLPEFPKHFSYDLVLFGSWRRKGVDFMDNKVASPYKYPVVGAYFAPMYNVNYRLRVGASVDAIYDGSANVYTEDFIVGTAQQFFNPGIAKQLALGLSARADYVMPIFTIGLGIGGNVLRSRGDLGGTYQSFSLKVMSSKHSFIHIGYNLKDFHEPNYLMLGLGYRFHNRRPLLLSH